MKVTLNNAFHNTSKTVNLKHGLNIISARRLREWKKDLCCVGCTCSGIDGTRGDKNSNIESYDLPAEYTAIFESTYDQKTGKQILIIDIL